MTIDYTHEQLKRVQQLRREYYKKIMHKQSNIKKFRSLYLYLKDLDFNNTETTFKNIADKRIALRTLKYMSQHHRRAYDVIVYCIHNQNSNKLTKQNCNSTASVINLFNHDIYDFTVNTLWLILHDKYPLIDHASQTDNNVKKQKKKLQKYIDKEEALINAVAKQTHITTKSIKIVGKYGKIKREEQIISSNKLNSEYDQLHKEALLYLDDALQVFYDAWDFIEHDLPLHKGLN